MDKKWMFMEMSCSHEWKFYDQVIHACKPFAWFMMSWWMSFVTTILLQVMNFTRDKFRLLYSSHVYLMQLSKVLIKCLNKFSCIFFCIMKGWIMNKIFYLMM
jgi:hypothetical protein